MRIPIFFFMRFFEISTEKLRENHFNYVYFGLGDQSKFENFNKIGISIKHLLFHAVLKNFIFALLCCVKKFKRLNSNKWFKYYVFSYIIIFSMSQSWFGMMSDAPEWT